MMRRSIRGNPTLTVVSILVWIVVLFGSATLAQERLRITINDVVEPLEGQGILEVSLANPDDAIFAFSLHVVLNRNDIANFQTRLDTVEYVTYWFCQTFENEVCTDSVGIIEPWIEKWNIMHVDSIEAQVADIDTASTLISGWDLVAARSAATGELGLDILVTAVCNTGLIPGTVPPLSPQNGNVLFRLPFDMKSVPPIPLPDYTATATISTGFKRWFGFVTPGLEPIGWTTETVADSSFFMCNAWGPPPDEECLAWLSVYRWECPSGECDSVAVEMIDIAVFDDAHVTLENGSITMRLWICGDVNGDSDVTIGDISLVIDHLFINNPPIDPIEPGNVNCSTEQPVVLTIGDVSTLIDHLFISEEPLCCQEH